MVGGQKLVILATPIPATRGPTEQQVECEPQLNVWLKWFSGSGSFLNLLSPINSTDDTLIATAHA